MIVKIRVKGAVQGVGYRPFIANKATEYGLKGFVRNIGAAVDILVLGKEPVIDSFTEMIKSEYPAGAFILSMEKSELTSGELDERLQEEKLSLQEFESDFRIIHSEDIDLSSELPVFLPDIGICEDCTEEMLDENDRRHGYPLISCAVCGPRISILNALPYDRDTTAMIDFKMCPRCEAEYRLGRRRHAQTISCFDCGPQMELMTGSDKKDSVAKAVSMLRNQEIIGLKGVSGYQLVCKPTDEAANKLRECKGRENKPFAVMFSDIDAVREYCSCSEKEAELLKSSARPIVLLERRKEFPYSVCRDSRYIGAFLPSAGIHRLLTDAVGPIIVTSANISDEPIIIDDKTFMERFLSPADSLVSNALSHKRDINIPQDDSVMFVTELNDGTEIESFNRRARGFVPLPVFVDNKDPGNSSILALGGDLKNTFALGKKDRVILSPYIGDLKDYGCNINERRLIDRFSDIFHFKADKIVCDLHPLYESSALAQKLSNEQNLPILRVQHHHAHILSVMAEKALKSCIGISFDGTGYGTDGRVWGGEVLYCRGTEYLRKGHLSYVKLCGGDKASKDARLVRQCYEHAASVAGSDIQELTVKALENNIGTFETSSMGRLFDCACELLGIKDYNSFEGECAIALETAAWAYVQDKEKETTPILTINMQKIGDCYIIDQVLFFKELKKLKDSGQYRDETLAFAFHMAICDMVRDICHILRDETGENKVCLSGGVFGNRMLLKNIFEKLTDDNFEVYSNNLVPAGDSGISLGQAYYGLITDHN